jgi:hypothetical protein
VWPSSAGVVDETHRPPFAFLRRSLHPGGELLCFSATSNAPYPPIEMPIMPIRFGGRPRFMAWQRGMNSSTIIAKGSGCAPASPLDTRWRKVRVAQDETQPGWAARNILAHRHQPGRSPRHAVVLAPACHSRGLLREHVGPRGAEHVVFHPRTGTAQGWGLTWQPDGSARNAVGRGRRCPMLP